MKTNTPRSGSIEDWRHTPNLTPRGYEIKKDELYVVNGDTLIKAYHLLLNQRFSALQMVSQQPPTNIVEIDQYLSLAKHINMVLYHMLHSEPLVNVLQMQELARIESEKLKNESQGENTTGITLKEMLDKFHMTDGGTKDELPPPKLPNENEDTNE